VKHRVAELEGAPLDAAVAKAEGWEKQALDDGSVWWWSCAPEWRNTPGNAQGKVDWFHPSTDWADGGPIIYREKIDTSAPEEWSDDQRWYAGMYQGKDAQHSGMNHEARGGTPLIAAMRCFVASRFGEFVEIP